MAAIIDLFKLNDKLTDPSGAPNALDRRVELRTMAYVRAVDFRSRLSSAQQRGETNLEARIKELMKEAARATGFWGVWMSVFRIDHGWLDDLLPGTALRTWVP